MSIRSRFARTWLLLGVLGAALPAASHAAPDDQAPTTPSDLTAVPVSGGAPEGWSVVFDDDFDGSGDLAVGSADSHTIGFLWESDRLVWSIDGTVVKTVTDTTLIPDVYSYIILSREMNSGVKREGIDGFLDGDPIELTITPMMIHDQERERDIEVWTLPGSAFGTSMM